MSLNFAPCSILPCSCSPPAAALLLARGWLQLGYILPSELQTPVFECVVRPPHERGLSLPRLYKSVSMQLFFLLLGGEGVAHK